MTITAGPSLARRATRPANQGPRMWLLAGHWYLIAYLIVQFNALTSVVSLPSLVSFIVVPAAGGVVLLLAPRDAWRDAPVSLLAFAFLFWLTASVIWSTDPTMSTYTVRIVIVGTGMSMLVVAVLPVERVIAALISFTRVCVVMTAVILVVKPGTRQTFEPATQDFLLGWRAGFIHKNAMGMAFVMLIAVVLVFDRHGWLRRATLIGAGVLVLGSRSATAYGGFLVVIGTYLWCRKLSSQSVAGARVTYVLGTLLLSLIGTVAGVIYAPTVLGLFGKDLTFTNRTDIWTASLNALGKHPWLGYGLAALFFRPDREPTYTIDRAIGFEAAHAHNGALDLALQAGVIGLVIYLVIFVAVLRRGLSLIDPAPDYATWTLMACAAILVMSIPENIYFGAMLGYLLILYGVLLKVSRRHAEPPGPALTSEVVFRE